MWPMTFNVLAVVAVVAYAVTQWRRGQVEPEPGPAFPPRRFLVQWDLEELVPQLRRGGWWTTVVPDYRDPRAMAWVRRHGDGVVDVVQLLVDRPAAYAYRVQLAEGDTELNPAGPLRWYLIDDDLPWIIQQAIVLPPPGTPAAPAQALTRPPIADVLPALLAEVRRHVVLPPTR